VFFGSHYKVVRFVLVVHDVFEIDARARVEIAEEFLVENERHAADFFNAGLRLRELVDEVDRYRDGQLAAELFPLEPCDITDNAYVKRNIRRSYTIIAMSLSLVCIVSM
jgi:hypothetical protein